MLYLFQQKEYCCLSVCCCFCCCLPCNHLRERSMGCSRNLDLCSLIYTLPTIRGDKRRVSGSQVRDYHILELLYFVSKVYLLLNWTYVYIAYVLRTAGSFATIETRILHNYIVHTYFLTVKLWDKFIHKYSTWIFFSFAFSNICKCHR